MKTPVLKSLFNNVAGSVLESILNKGSGLKACSFIKKRFYHRCFPVKFAKFLTTFFLEHLRWLVLIVECTFFIRN